MAVTLLARSDADDRVLVVAYRVLDTSISVGLIVCLSVLLLMVEAVLWALGFGPKQRR